MERVTHQQYMQIVHEVPWERWDEPQYRRILDQHRVQERESLKRGLMISGLVSIALVSSLFITNALIPQNTEREARVEQMANEMPYGIR